MMTNYFLKKSEDMFKKISLLSGAMMMAVLIFAQPALQSKKGNEFIFSDSKSKLKLDFCTSSMFRVRTSWDESNESWMVVKYDWPSVSVNVTQQKGFTQLQTTVLTVKIYASPLRIDVISKDGKLLSSENVNGGGSYKKQDTVGCVKQLFPDEHFFGFGERMDFLDRRQKKLKLDVGRGKGQPHIVGAYNILEANYSPIPFFMSTRGYGIFFHNAFPTEWDMGNTSNQSFSFSASGGELDYYFIYGPKFPSILDQYTNVTGKSPLLPLYGYGLHVGTYSGGTWGYEKFSSDLYVVELARKLRALGIPVDILWLDSTWRIFGEVGGKGATSFEWRDTFKDPKECSTAFMP
jgi:alpha-glucosidase